MDKERLKSETFFNENYFDELLEEIRETRIGERNFYQKLLIFMLLDTKKQIFLLIIHTCHRKS